MASTTAFFSGLSGLTANARDLDVIGNNISNVNTTAFKSSRLMFSAQFSRTLSGGTPPGTNTGGTNPTQIGLGVAIGGTERNCCARLGLFHRRPARSRDRRRRLLHRQSRQQHLLHPQWRSARMRTTTSSPSAASSVQGFGVDSNFNVVPGVLHDINIPIGTMTIAEPTKTVNLGGNLNAGGDLPTEGSLTNFAALGALPTATPPPTGADLLETNTRLVDIADPANPTNPLFVSGDSIKLSGAKKGTQDVPDATLAIPSTTTVQDYLNFLNNSLNINTAAGANPDGKTPGAALNPATGVISIVGNTGTTNSLDVQTSDVSLVTAGGTATNPLAATTANAADGESVLTSFVAYDSLGTPVTINLRMTLQSKQGGSGTTWSYQAESPDNKGTNAIVGNGTLNFDSAGRVIGTPTLTLDVDRTGTGAASPLMFNLNLGSQSSGVTALSDQSSSLAALSQDGAPIGTLQSFTVGQDGTITGAFSNGLTRPLGQVAVASFTNPDGLSDLGGSLYSAGPNSGEPLVGAPLTLGAGKVVGGALELSNVDLSQEFVNMILASTGYSAASRVITTTDQLMQQLLAIGR